MREFKFRSWDEPSDEYGNWWMCYFDRWDFIKGDYDVLMQYTWLKDKNGKEIYEGDILKVKNDTYKMFRAVNWNEKTDGIFVIVWERSSFMKRDITDTPMELKNDSYLWLINDYDKENTLNCEVIGNVHENPELLTK